MCEAQISVLPLFYHSLHFFLFHSLHFFLFHSFTCSNNWNVFCGRINCKGRQFSSSSIVISSRSLVLLPLSFLLSTSVVPFSSLSNLSAFSLSLSFSPHDDDDHSPKINGPRNVREKDLLSPLSEHSEQ